MGLPPNLADYQYLRGRVDEALARLAAVERDLAVLKEAFQGALAISQQERRRLFDLAQEAIDEIAKLKESLLGLKVQVDPITEQIKKSAATRSQVYVSIVIGVSTTVIGAILLGLIAGILKTPG